MDYAPRQLPACDLCYAKKTRCDRNDPCLNCVAAKVECQRRRRRQSSNKNGSFNNRLNAVLERMSRLEKNLKGPSPPESGEARSRRPSGAGSSMYSEVMTALGAVSPSSEQQQEQQADWAPSTMSEETAASGGPPSSRKRPADSPLESARQQSGPQPTQLDDEGQSPRDKVLASLDLNRYLKPTAASSGSREMNSAQQRMLESAIWLAKQAMTEPKLEYDRAQGHNLYEPSMYPSIEFLHLLLHVMHTSVETTYFLSLFASTTSSALEQMVLALRDCSVHGQQRIQYLICVNHVAYSFITALDSKQTPEMRDGLKMSKKRYRDNVVTAVGLLDTSVRPDVSLLYALQSGAMLMQDIGRMRMCWKLNTLACQVGAALRGRSMAELGIFGPGDITAFRIACIRSYIFDTGLSANNHQPACLARMDIDRSVLDISKPGFAMLSTLLSFAEVQEVIIYETRKLAAPGKENQMDLVRLANLQKQMADIHMKSQEYRAHPDSISDAYLRFEWETIDFMYYSNMTTITRLSSTSDNPYMHEKCLENSRNALLKLKHLLELRSRVTHSDQYLSSLAWVVPLYPLRSLYFLFHNIIKTSNTRDLRLLQDIAKGLEEPAQSLHSIMEIWQLCNSLLSLYTDYAESILSSPFYKDMQPENNKPANSQQLGGDPVVRQDCRRPPSGQMGPWPSLQLFEPPGSRHSTNDLGLDLSVNQERHLLQTGAGPVFDASFFDQQINWELFYAQDPSDLT